MKLIEACEKVLQEDPKTRDNKYLWAYFIKVLEELGYKVYIELKKGIPSPESIIKERRTLLNQKNLFPKSFEPEANTTYESKK